ncbi:hypothetical protein [Tellurirhabdus rosea]|uniref:hypothetical protein n=1 Tax=Tellurirhabdus rosea TaxID=2674997 RepID=UPI002253C699|nr:hypothetical protein [Tellurirhabdus rosea]
MRTAEAVLEIYKAFPGNVQKEARTLLEKAALTADCPTLCFEDLQNGQVIDGRLVIRSPFA